MLDKKLFVLVEGDDDERFFENVVKPRLQERYGTIKVVPYQQKKDKKIINSVRVIKKMGAEYIFVRDLNGEPCISSKKTKLMARWSVLEDKKILIVAKKIEGWYLAGLDEDTRKKLRIRRDIGNTNDVDKEEFKHITPKNLSPKQFMIKIIRNYNVEIAKTRNDSFGYFSNKWINGVSSI